MPPVAAEEGLRTETEKKRSKAAERDKKEREGEKVTEGDGDEFSLLQGPPKHVPALSWTARGRSRWWCSPAVAPGLFRGFGGGPIGARVEKERAIQNISHQNKMRKCI